MRRLADRWQWEENGRRLRIFLREDVRFHDGTVLTADAVADALRALAGDKRRWSGYPSLEQITAVRAENNSTVVIELSEPSSFILEDLTAPITGRQPQIGTGPFRIVKSTDSTIELERFDAYYLGMPAIDRVVLKPFDALRTTWASLLRNEVDMITDVPRNSVEFIRNDDVNVITWQRWYQFLVGFNSRVPALQSPDVRRALNLAIDREALISQVLEGVAIPSTGPIWYRHWAYDNSVSPYRFDRGSAEALLDAAGFRKDRLRGTGDFPPARLRFVCLIPEGYSVWERVGLELQRQLYDVGVDMRFESVPQNTYLERLAAGDFEAVLIDMISGPSMGRAYTFWRSARYFKGERNVFGYENPETERLFGVLKTATNDAAIVSATSRLQRELLEDPPALFIAWTDRARAVRGEFVVHQDPGRDPLSTLWRWEPTSRVSQAAVP